MAEPRAVAGGLQARRRRAERTLVAASAAAKGGAGAGVGERGDGGRFRCSGGGLRVAVVHDLISLMDKMHNKIPVEAHVVMQHRFGTDGDFAVQDME
ncbi:hypothetical protein EJB05_45279, partial [Eragrostis curvula]